MKVQAALIALVASSAMIAPAFAEQAAQQATVTYSDLDLSSAEGRATFERRIDDAINNVCGLYDGTPYVQVLQCRHETKRNVIEASSGMARAALTDEAPAPTTLAAR